jgi:hypothetical protein
LNNDLTATNWMKSTRCGTAACVEVAFGDSIMVRDSKAPSNQPLTLSRSVFAEFVGGIKAGDFDVK